MHHAKLKPASNAADWSTPVQFLDRQTGGLVDLTGSSFKIALAATTPSGWADYGSRSCSPPILTGSTDTGEITIAAPGTVLIYFSADRMRNLAPGMYRVGMLVQNDGRTVQLIIGYLPVNDGVVMWA